MINTASEQVNISVEIVGGLNDETKRFDRSVTPRNGYDI